MGKGKEYWQFLAKKGEEEETNRKDLNHKKQFNCILDCYTAYWLVEVAHDWCAWSCFTGFCKCIIDLRVCWCV